MRNARSLTLTLALSGLCWAGCTTSHMEDEDSSITFNLDGAMFDTGVDAPRPRTVIGSECSVDTECGTDGLCASIPQLLSGGYCTQACDASLACPEGSSCLNLGGGQSYCFLDCDPDATTRTCERTAYGCSTNFRLFPAPVCVDGCFDASDCPSGLSCDPTGGFAGAGACFDPSSMVGDPCITDGDCPSGGACIPEDGSGWPGGTCVVGCDVATNAGCDGGACIPQTFGGGLCTVGCATDTDCRDGYACREVTGFPGRMYCAPGCAGNTECSSPGNVCNPSIGTCDVAFNASLLGGTCRRDGMGCEGGSCLSESTSGYPMSYCAYAGCTVGGTDCPAGGVCAPGSGSVNICLRGCGDPGACRAGYNCAPADPADAESPTACVPSCIDDSQCSGGGGVVRTCNLGTGRCTVAFDGSRQGEPCAAASECPGGRCHDEADDGWPAGMCVSIGCRLSGTGGSSDCAAGNTCVDDALGDPAIGECLPTCVMDGTTCRPGYACVGDEGASEGVCRPACTATSCDPARTCDSGTGLCG